jgi:oligopeptide transport system ATP-binding protein
VELAESRELCGKPLHPYTKVLLQAVPIPDPQKTRSRTRAVLAGDIPSPMEKIEGCKFHTLCPHATKRCAQETPELRELAPGHWGACMLYA